SGICSATIGRFAEKSCELSGDSDRSSGKWKTLPPAHAFGSHSRDSRFPAAHITDILYRRHFLRDGGGETGARASGDSVATQCRLLAEALPYFGAAGIESCC